MLGKILNTFGTRLISAILNLLIAVVISQFLGPGGKGEQSLIIVTISYILVFSNLMGGGAIVFLTPRFHYATILIPAYIWSTLTAAIFFAALYFFELLNSQYILHICLLSVLNAFTSVNSSILIGKEKIKASNLIALVQPVIIMISLSVFFFVFKISSLETYLVSLYLAFVISFLISIFYLSRFAGLFRFGSSDEYFVIVRQMLHYGILNQLAHIFQLLSFRMSFFWLQQLYSEAEVGIYSNGTSLVESIWLISRSISMVQYARISNSSDIRYSQKLTINLTYAAMVASLLLIMIMILLPPQLFTFIFGAGFADVGRVIQSLAPGVLFFNIALIMGHYFSGIGKYHVNTIASFAGLVVSVILFSVMIPSMGIFGAGWATSISYTITSLIVLIYFFNESRLNKSEILPTMNEIREVFGQIFTQLHLKK
ncbi:MAG: polysaccharide biosynthesis C-terminal domain-containing protein [Bacteroidales bacterium]|nr:polysaccharide biosynthesis C-terminal domain-containing protein [Bacteroidales bacterium]